MPTDDELTFADHMARFYVRRFAFPPMVGRLYGYLAICDPPDQTINELAEALMASRSAVTGGVKVLEQQGSIRRTRAAGERMDRVRLDHSSRQAQGFDIAEYQEQRDLAHEGLDMLKDAPAERRAALLEMAALAEFLVERVPVLEQEWQARRAALRAENKLPDPQKTDRHPPGGGRSHRG